MLHEKLKMTLSYFQIANQFLREGKLEDAIAAYRLAVEQNPNFSWSHHNLGDALAKLDRLDEAAAAYRNALEINSNLALSHYKLGEILAKLGQLDEATTCFRKAIEINPDYSRFRNNLSEFSAKLDNLNEAITSGIAKAQLQEEDETITTYRRDLELNPNSAMIHHLLGHSLAQRQQWGEAITFYRRAIELYPNSDVVHYHLGLALTQIQQLDEAVACFRKAVELNPEGLEYREQLNYVLQKPLLDQKITNLRHAIKVKPDGKSCQLLGEALTKQGKVEDAIAAYKKAVVLQPTRVEFYWDLAWLLSQQNQWDQAISFYSRAGEMKPEGAADHFGKNSQYTLIKLLELTETDRSILDQAGLSVEQLKLMKIDCLDREEIYINSFGYSPKIKLEPLGFPAFQHSILETGYIYSICPISQEIIRSNQSFFGFINSNWQMIFYRFVGREVFYLIVGCYPLLKVGIYLPNREVIISFIDYSDSHFKLFGETEFQLCIDGFKIYTLNFLHDVKNYITNNHPKKIVNLFGFIPNIGHYFWNDLPPLQTLSETGKINKLSKFIIGGFNYINIDNIFSEITSEKLEESILVSREDLDQNTLFKINLTNNFFALRLSSEGIKEKLISRIYNFSRTKSSESFLQKVTESKKHFPLLWITIRSHNRVWISQVEGIANIINTLSKDFPDLGVIFDGLPRETDNLERIRKLLHSPIKTYSALGCTIYETIVWVHAIDLFIEPVGAGLIFPILANKTGVYHTHRGLTPLDPSWVPQRENGVSLIQVHKDSIVDSYDSAYHSFFERNYDCDWKGIYDKVVKIIDNLGSNE